MKCPKCNQRELIQDYYLTDPPQWGVPYCPYCDCINGTLPPHHEPQKPKLEAQIKE